VFLRTYLVHSTYVFLCTRATKVGKIVNPAVQNKLLVSSGWSSDEFLL